VVSHFWSPPFRRILFGIVGLAAWAAPLALAQSGTNFTALRQALQDWAIEGTISDHAADGIVAKGATAVHEFTDDPNRDTVIVAVCEDAACSDVKVVGSDSTGAFAMPEYSLGSAGIVTLFAGSIPSEKLKVEVSAPGCINATCAYALSVSSRPRTYPAEK
jgi:hypothetical protein